MLVNPHKTETVLTVLEWNLGRLNAFIHMKYID